MSEAETALLEYALRHVTPRDVIDFAPGDPGYPEYVRVWTEIVETGRLPTRACFDVTETVGLTRWSDARREDDERRFRRFRVFTNAIALALSVRDADARESMPPNYTAICLIDDAVELGDTELLLKVKPALAALNAALVEEREEAAFIILAILLINRIARGEGPEAETLITELIREADAHAGHASNQFLWGCSFFDQLHGKWKRYVYRYLTPKTPELAALRERLLSTT